MLEEPVLKYTHHKLTVVDINVSISDAAKVMVESKIDSILISEENDIVGILTNKDILAEVVAKGKDPDQIKVGEIAHKPIIKIHQDSSVKEAIALMEKNDIRRLIVWDDSRPIGMISQKMIVGNMGQYAVSLPELEIPRKVKCPYCSSFFDDKNILSKHIVNIHVAGPSKYICPYCYSVFEGKKILSGHIDNIHIGRGLLEGNISKVTI